jgi:hypothetical protein
MWSCRPNALDSMHGEMGNGELMLGGEAAGPISVVPGQVQRLSQP